MKIVFALVLAIGLCANAAHADVVVYRGSDKMTADIVSAAPFGASLGLYLVVDYDAGQYGTLLFGNIEGSKRFSRGNAATNNFATVPLLKGTGTVIVNATRIDTSPTVFLDGVFFYRGVNKNLLIRDTPGTTFVNRPKTLVGSGIIVSSGVSGTAFDDQRFSLKFQGGATIVANDANETIDQALDALVTVLTHKGFTGL